MRFCSSLVEPFHLSNGSAMAPENLRYSPILSSHLRFASLGASCLRKHTNSSSISSASSASTFDEWKEASRVTLFGRNLKDCSEVLRSVIDRGADVCNGDPFSIVAALAIFFSAVACFLAAIFFLIARLTPLVSSSTSELNTCHGTRMSISSSSSPSVSHVHALDSFDARWTISWIIASNSCRSKVPLSLSSKTNISSSTSSSSGSVMPF
mmetsp:Transcript_58998/g.138853  ORF Transcript_58998/g.138853 Transcript_58998/m.138853 type:complete len:210 (+) Transcript_58998:65-694(+)